MIARLRGALGLLVVVALALLAAWLGSWETEPRYPAGSSRSYRPDGAQALYLWAEALGARPLRLDRPELPRGDLPRLLLVVQPQLPVSPSARALLDDVPRAGGTLVVAGDTVALRPYLDALGVSVEARPIVTRATLASQGQEVPMNARQRLRAAGAEPLLLDPGGGWLALRKPYLGGTLVVLATPYPLTNGGLGDAALAGFVYRTLLAGLPPGAAVAFDESHSTVGPPEPGEVGLPQLVAGRDPGRATLYAAGLTFLFLLLAGRRLGPPLPAASPGEASRTMYEHVQALAGLYRRARQLRPLRDHFARHYARAAARALGAELPPPDRPAELEAALREHGVPADRAARLAAALAAVAHARAEAQLMDAVGEVDGLVRDLPRARRATLSAA